MKICLLDLDGVLADMNNAAAALHGKPTVEELGLVGDAAWGFYRHWGMSKSEFYAPMGYDFWRGLDKTAEADEIVGAALERFGADNVAALTSPIRTPGCVEGKLDWVAHHYPALHVFVSRKRRTGGEPPKWMMAHPDALLVDDSGKNVDAFNLAGGNGFLFPRLWNTRHNDADRGLDMLLDEMSRMCGGD